MTDEPDLPSVPPEDGLVVRETPRWTLDKLDIIKCYLDGFARACSKKAQRWYLVDGFAGPGVNEIRETGRRCWGSPILALMTERRFHRCLFMDADSSATAALQARTQGFQPRAVVEEGDVNTDLLPAMRQYLDPRSPCLVLLDPEGADLLWPTVEQLSGFRTGRFKTELLVLLPTHTGFIRMLPTDPDQEIPGWAVEAMDRIYGPDRWRDIWERRRIEQIDSDTATTEYVERYAENFEQLGYSTVLDRAIRKRGTEGQLGYFLIFATTHDAGRDIMQHCFDTIFTSDPQYLLPGFTHERRRRLP